MLFSPVHPMLTCHIKMSYWNTIVLFSIDIYLKGLHLFSASANICNVALMRHNELSEGIDVLDSNGNVVGSSRIAAKHVRI